MEDLKRLFELYPILNEIDKKHNGIIRKNLNFKRMTFGECISSVRNACNGIIFIVSGKIKIHRINKDGNEIKLYDIGKGNLCHEAFSCILKCEPLNIIGGAVENSLICIIPVDIVKRYLLIDSNFMNYMYTDLYKKFNIMIEKKEEKIHDSVRNRIIKMFINEDNKILYKTHNEIALEIDSKREVVSRSLKVLENEGYIQIKRGKILILKDIKSLLEK